ncbi:hypothetical protein [Sulfitobacter sp. MF3-043]|uniref:hypothetical protein n=1 Tax=Sulfitobacter sediminivivens TaxID=3252902 RepID=UPI0036D7EBBB
MNRPPKTPLEPWQTLLTSSDIFSDLCDIYDANFFESFASRFDRNPKPFDLFKGVTSTAHAYVTGKWAKSAENSKLLQYSGVHLIGAGMSARRLSAELDQVAKSERAVDAVHNSLSATLENDVTRPHAAKAYRAIQFRAGPQSRLRVIQELASALEEAIEGVIDLPLEFVDEAAAKPIAFDFVSANNSNAQKTLPKNHPMEEAARAFKPPWEEFSSVAYRRGRFDHTIGGYNCEAGVALHQIIKKIDSNVALSLAGTAIENIRAQLKDDIRSD